MDHRFALVDTEGVERYPYRINKRDGRVGFVLGREREGEGKIVQTIEEVIRGVVFDGKPVRTSDFPSTKAKGSNGLSLAARREVQGYRIDPSLRYLVDEAPIQPMGVPVNPQLSDGAAMAALQASGNAVVAGVPQVDRFKKLEALSVDDYAAALDKVEPIMTAAQREMLRGHANAPAQELSMKRIAELGGYPDGNTANMQYGLVGRRFADALEIDPNQLPHKIQAIGVLAARKDEARHDVWRLRHQLAEALVRAGWKEPEPAASDEPAAAGAAAEVNADPECKGLPETTRRALINARIGQGGFRKRMMIVWGGRCAVTDLGIQEALTASHAMAWKHSDNGERLDAYNGLLLSATVDRLFDRGLISFASDGALLLQANLSEAELRIAGLTLESRLRFLPSRCLPYLAEHRKRFGFDGGAA